MIFLDWTPREKQKETSETISNEQNEGNSEQNEKAAFQSEQTFPKHRSESGLICKIYKELYNSIAKTTRQQKPKKSPI